MARPSPSPRSPGVVALLLLGVVAAAMLPRAALAQAPSCPLVLIPVIDSSGSMFATEPGRGDPPPTYRLELVRRLTSTIVSEKLPACVGAVVFGGGANSQRVLPVRRLDEAGEGPFVSALEAALTDMGGTDYVSALERVRGLLDGLNGARDVVLAFVSDGQPGPNTSEQIRRVAGQVPELLGAAPNTRLFTVGMGDAARQGSVGAGVLETMARDGRAEYFAAASREQLPGIAQRILAAYLNGRASSATVSPGPDPGASQVTTVDVGTGVRALEITLQNTERAGMTVAIHPPTGDPIRLVTPDGQAFAVQRIERPQQGTWRVEVTSRSRVQVDTLQIPSGPPPSPVVGEAPPAPAQATPAPAPQVQATAVPTVMPTTPPTTGPSAELTPAPLATVDSAGGETAVGGDPGIPWWLLIAILATIAITIGLSATLWRRPTSAVGGFIVFSTGMRRRLDRLPKVRRDKSWIIAGQDVAGPLRPIELDIDQFGNVWVAPSTRPARNGAADNGSTDGRVLVDGHPLDERSMLADQSVISITSAAGEQVYRYEAPRRHRGGRPRRPVRVARARRPAGVGPRTSR